MTIALLSLLMACGPVELLDLDLQTEAQLQALAIAAACREAACGDRPVLVPRDTSQDLRQALAASLPNEIRYFDDLFAEALLGPDGFYLDGATAAVTSAPYELGEKAIGVDIWTHKAQLHGMRKTYLFLWDGTAWTETTADEVGVTLTTSVS
ncbi:MAG: hypothetical protein WD651_00515 [Acidimicrobiia bacterium]